MPRVEEKTNRLHPSRESALLRSISAVRSGAVQGVEIFDDYVYKDELDSRTVDVRFTDGEMLRVKYHPSGPFKGRTGVLLYGRDEALIWEASNAYNGHWLGNDYRGPAPLAILDDPTILRSARQTASTIETVLAGNWAQPLPQRPGAVPPR
jgi:hypothetical protein